MSFIKGLAVFRYLVTAACNMLKTLVALFMAVYTMSVLATEIAGPDSESVTAVVDSYFLALQTGDTDGLLALMSASEYELSQSVLSEPGYSSLLIDRYRGATLEVVSSQEKNGVYLVNLAIHLTSDDVINERLVLKSMDSSGYPQYRIFKRDPL